MNNQPKITEDLSLEEQIEQVKKLNNPEFVPRMLENDPIDIIPNGEGEFGKSPTNPIPVNGTWGERIYLSFLRCELCGKEVLFHRIGSLSKNINNKSFIIDNYEVCCYDGCTREHIYLAPYFPKRSIYLPKGYSDFNLNQNFATKLFIDFPTSLGTNWFIKDFPFGLEDFIKFYFTEVVGNPSMTRGRLEKYKEITENLKNEELIQHRKEVYRTIKDTIEKYDLSQKEYLEAMKMEDPLICWEKNSNGEMPSKLEQWKIVSDMKASEYAKNKKREIEELKFSKTFIDREDKEEIYRRAIKMIKKDSLKNVSRSYLIRKLGLGYNAVSIIIDTLIERGYLEESNGKSTNKVIHT